MFKKMLVPELKHIDRLENLLHRIWSGELKHDQSGFYSECLTAACVCGWDKALDRFDGDILSAAEDEQNPWHYSQQKYGLTAVEAYLLFSTHSTKELQKIVMTRLKENKRLTIDEEDITIDSRNYNDENFKLVCFDDPKQKIVDEYLPVSTFIEKVAIAT
jgi:hypothetical protein